MSAKTGYADADGVLCAGYVPVLTLGVVLETEDQTGKHLGIHIGQLHGPYLLDHLAGAGAQAASVTYLKGGFQRDGDGPTGMVLADIGLVYPGSGKIQPCWNTAIGCWLKAIGSLQGTEGCLQGTGTTGL